MTHFPGKILMVLSAADNRSRTSVVLHEKLVQAGCRVDIATPGGRAVSGTLAAPLRLSDVRVAGYDVVAIPGGHGPVEDLYRDSDMGRILVDADAAGRIIASVCHGPAALLGASTSDGWWPFAGRRMTACSGLATRLKELGAYYERGPERQAYVVRDGNLITGQNPASTGPLADAVLEALGVPVSE